jgi:hypothetical protein
MRYQRKYYRPDKKNVCKTARQLNIKVSSMEVVQRDQQ